MSTVDDIIAELIESIRNGEVCVFAGAGISFNSGLPVVNQLVPFILSLFDVSEKDIETYLKSRFCFEEFMQTLLECSGRKDSHLLLGLFLEGRPNTNHNLLAKLVKRGYLRHIVTTNFDLLIEKALKAPRFRREKHYDVFHREEDFDQFDWNDVKPFVVKIHGSIEDMETMAITLERVAKQEFSKQRREIIERVFSTGKHKNVLVLGYSSSDIFDISPHIATLEGELKRVIFIEHDTKNPKVENLALRKGKNPFKQFKGSYRVFYDTDTLVKTVWKSLIKENYGFRQWTTPWKEHVDEWCDSINSSLGAVGTEIAARIFYSISDFKTAEKYIKKNARIYHLWEEEKQVAIDSILGDIYFRLGDTENAVYTYADVIDTAKRMDFKKSYPSLFCRYGDMLEEHGDFEKASTYYMRAFSDALRSGDEKEATAAHAKWGNTCNRRGEFNAAKFILGKALEKADGIGDIRTKAVILGYLGDSHAGLKEPEKAIGYYEQAIEADRNLGHKSSEGIHLGKAGDAYIDLGEHLKAIDHFQHALKIAQATEDDKEKVVLLTVLGSVHRVIGAYQEAINEYREALKIFTKKLEERYPWMMRKLKGDALCGLGTCYMQLGKYREAIDAYEKSRTFMSITADERIFLSLCHTLGILYRKLEKHDKAIYNFEEALEIDRKLEDRKRDDMEEEIDILVNLGLSHNDRGTHQEALDIYEKGLKTARQISDKKREIDILIKIGNTQLNLHKYDDSLNSFDQAIAILEDLLIKMGQTQFSLQGYSKFFESLEKSCAILKPLLEADVKTLEAAQKKSRKS